jgi:hypothetical protein
MLGLFLFAVGGVCEYKVITDITDVSLWMTFVGPLIFGLGGGILAAQIHDTWKIRRAGREWLAANPEPEDELLLEDDMGSPHEPRVRYKRNGRGERRAIRNARRVPAEDNPYWPSYAARWVDKPENPTDEPGEGRTQ